MVEANKKQDFLRYILDQKYGKIFSNDKTYIEIMEDLNIQDPTIKSFILEISNSDTEQKKEYLTNLDKLLVDNNITNDFIFCVINSDPALLKVFKDKDLPLVNLRQIYDSAFKSNKSFLKSFNAKEKVKKAVKKDVTKIPVVTRFSPEPSGCLHIGHVKALLVAYNMAKKSNGKLLLRFDDTNPVKDYERYEKEILRDLETLDISCDNISHSSDYFDCLVERAFVLINKDLAYVDNTDQDTMRSERFDGIESKYRNNDKEFNLEIFQKMLNGLAPGYCLRAKINMSDPNKTMRDPVIYRCSDKSHCRCDKYKAYPTYDFVCPIIDSIEGVTVATRADEYKDRNDQYKWFIKNLDLDNKPDLSDFSKLNLADTVLSKRKIDKLIMDKVVTGWDDPRVSTVQGIKRLGLLMTTLKEYINLQGASGKTNIITWDKIWAMNKKAIDPISPRFMAIEKEKYVRIIINNHDDVLLKSVPLHKKNPSLGNKLVLYNNIILISQDDALILKKDEEFTLMNWGNAIVKDKLIKDDVVLEIKVDLNLQGDYKTTVNKISWISELGSIMVKGIEYGNILINDEINPSSKKEVLYLCESSVLEKARMGMHVQFERIGFFYYDSPFVFHLVPSTKQKRS